MLLRNVLAVSGAAARWGLGCYRRHFLLVGGLSVVPTAQRFFVVGYDVPAPVAVGSEVLVVLARVLLVVLLLRILLAETGLRRAAAWSRLTAAIDARPSVFWLQAVILGAAFALFDIVPNALVATLVPAADRDTVTAVLVAVKNPTVIAFTFLWMVGVARTLILTPRFRAEAERRVPLLERPRGD